MVSSDIYYYMVKTICGQIKVVINILYKKINIGGCRNGFLYNFLLMPSSDIV
jgi:hypothetical protein